MDTFGNISGGAGYIDPEFLKMAGPLADYMYNGALWNYDLSRPDEKALDAELWKRYKVRANHHSGLMYSCVYLIKDVLERAGTTDRKKVREALAKTNITSGKALTVPTRFIRFDENGDNTGFEILAIQCIKGNYRTVWPQGFKSTEPVWPVPKWSERKI
jgi:branched-chain amino acid transport system substrate-binding protein